MKFVTSVDIARAEKKISYKDRILLLGSCFADNIGAKFGEYYYQTTVNPYGTLYNPASIAFALKNSKQTVDHSERLIYHNGLWHSLAHHGCFSHTDKEILAQRCEVANRVMYNALQEASVVIITFGTAWVYEYEGQVVANCHKVPANRFTRRSMTVNEIVELWQPIVASMPNKQWVFTVSPIRHIKDGLHTNQLSKAILLQAIDQLCQLSIACCQPSYFPAYEIMMDELRDYRFYAEDMVHPTALAVEYIWQKFVDAYITVDTQSEMKTLHQLWRDRQHRCLHPNSQEAQVFNEKLNQRIQQVQSVYPWIE